MASMVIAPTTALAGGLIRLPAAAGIQSRRSFGTTLRASPFVLPRNRRTLQVRSEDVQDQITKIRDATDKATKKEITADEIRNNQETNVSEQKSVFGSKPSSTGPYPRPELERRPETGDTTIAGLWAFDGPVPETVNGRLAMIGIFWAFVAERISGLTVYDQVYSVGDGLLYYLAIVPIVALISIVPFLNGESTDARSFGPFNAKAERWNGRLAMLAFLSLVIIESFTHTPVYRTGFFNF